MKEKRKFSQIFDLMRKILRQIECDPKPDFPFLVQKGNVQHDLKAKTISDEITTRVAKMILIHAEGTKNARSW